MENKFDQDNVSPTSNEDSGEEMKKDFKGFLGSTKKFLVEVLLV